jgi:hypothetical protein
MAPKKASAKEPRDSPPPDVGLVKKAPPQYLLNSMRNVLVMGAGLEALNHDVVKADGYAELLLRLVARHGEQLDKGENGVYTHKLVKDIMDRFEINGKTLAAVVQKTQVVRYYEDIMRDARKLIPICYTADCLDDNKALKSGKTLDDLAVDIKRVAWAYNKKDSEKFDSTLEWHQYHLNLLATLLYGPMTEYFSEDHKMHPSFWPLVQGSKAEEVREAQEERRRDQASGRQQRREAQKKKRTKTVDAAAPAPLTKDMLRLSMHQLEHDNLNLYVKNLHVLIENLREDDPERIKAVKDLIAVGKPKTIVFDLVSDDEKAEAAEDDVD